MKYTIRKTDTGWELVAADGSVVASFAGEEMAAYHDAIAHLGQIVSRDRAAALAAQDDGDASDGLLPERWTSDQGIAFQEALPGGRDFTECEWSWRDPANSLVPLMLQTANEGHWGAELAGFAEEFSKKGGTVSSSGAFYDNDAGRSFRDLLLGGRTFGVSVDPSEDIEIEYACVEYDDDGWCMEEVVKFLSYEIAGLTGIPFPGFEDAAIKLAASRRTIFLHSEGAGAIHLDTAVPILVEGSKEQIDNIRHVDVRAAISIPTVPPRAWFDLDEPKIGEPFLGGLGDDVLVEQGNSGAVACPLEIRDDGQVFGHVTYWGQCHVANPWGAGKCASAAPSTNGYADFHAGHVACADGSDLPTGLLHVGCEHSTAMDVRGVRDAAAHAGLAFAQVRAMDGEHGIWIRGSLLPTVTDAQVTTLRALTLSGEWVPEMGAVIAVNEGGLPLQRRAKIAASNGAVFPVANPVLRSSVKAGRLAKLVGGNVVRRCPECQKRAAAVRGERTMGVELHAALARQAAVLDTIERRTRHLIPVEAETTAARLRVAE